MNLGGDEWPIYIAEKESDGFEKMVNIFLLQVKV
jgi:hypothetical protein